MNQYYRAIGTSNRHKLEKELEALCIGFKIRSAREKMNMPPEELTSRIVKNRTFIKMTAET